MSLAGPSEVGLRHKREPEDKIHHHIFGGVQSQAPTFRLTLSNSGIFVNFLTSRAPVTQGRRQYIRSLFAALSKSSRALALGIVA